MRLEEGHDIVAPYAHSPVRKAVTVSRCAFEGRIDADLRGLSRGLARREQGTARFGIEIVCRLKEQDGRCRALDGANHPATKRGRVLPALGAAGRVHRCAISAVLRPKDSLDTPEGV